MTALQDWLGFRPVDQSTTIIRAVCRPLRAVLNAADPRDRDEFTVMGEGLERC